MVSGPAAEARKPETAYDGRFSLAERRLAQSIRRAYVMARSDWESLQRGHAATYVPSRLDDEGRGGSVDNDNRRDDKLPVWIVLARGFHQLGIDPEDYIFAAFERALKLKQPPEARYLLAATQLQAYREEKEQAVAARETAIFLATEKGIAEDQITYWQLCGMEPVAAHCFVLTDSSLELSALFRYCLALKLARKYPAERKRILKMAAAYKAAAAAQFYQDRAEYRRHWAGFLPKGFDEEAVRLHRQNAEEWDAEEEI